MVTLKKHANRFIKHHQSATLRMAPLLGGIPRAAKGELPMNVRLANGSELPSGWRPGQPLLGESVDLHTTLDCPFGPECKVCRSGLTWHPGLETHLKHLD